MVISDSLMTKSLLIIVPYLIGIALSSTVLPPQQQSTSSVASETATNNDIHTKQEDTTFGGLSFAIHRNGESSPCGSTIGNLESTLLSLVTGKDKQKSLRDLDSGVMTKYEVDKLLTEAFGKHLLSMSSCGPENAPTSIRGYKRKTWGRGENYKIDGVESSFLTFCDMGQERTPILHDHDELLSVSSGDDVQTLPCHFHTREGLRITSFDQLIDLTRNINNQNTEDCTVNSNGEQTCKSSSMMHLYAVPAGRLFMFAPSYVGEVFTLAHVKHPNPEPVTLKVLSVSPRVFDVVDFFEEDESKAIVDKALRETSESHKIKRSSTGASGYNVNSQRTSENGFDTHGTTAVAVKKYVIILFLFHHSLIMINLYHTHITNILNQHFCKISL
jgi:hypothetical protein